MNAKNTSTKHSYLFALFFLGFLLIIIGAILSMVAVALSGGQASFGGVIIVGPFPIIVGGGPEATLMVILAIILTILSIAIFLILNRKRMA